MSDLVGKWNKGTVAAYGYRNSVMREKSCRSVVENARQNYALDARSAAPRRRAKHQEFIFQYKSIQKHWFLPVRQDS
jgi:hypothetical protein